MRLVVVVALPHRRLHARRTQCWPAERSAANMKTKHGHPVTMPSDYGATTFGRVCTYLCRIRIIMHLVYLGIRILCSLRVGVLSWGGLRLCIDVLRRLAEPVRSLWLLTLSVRVLRRLCKGTLVLQLLYIGVLVRRLLYVRILRLLQVRVLVLGLLCIGILLLSVCIRLLIGRKACLSISPARQVTS